jgi:hypothetical protein
MIATSWLTPSTPSPLQLPPQLPKQLTQQLTQKMPSSSIQDSIRSVNLNAPTMRLSMASYPGINAVYSPRDPKSIPTGFARLCNKVGGFAPRPVWDDFTNGISPWFESEEGCYVYLNCNEACWYVDDASGAGMYRASPDGSLLLPPTEGWVTLQGQRVGAPKISFI